jgi:hypothetical protein
VPQQLDTPPIAQDYFRLPSDNFWNAVAIRPPSGGDCDLALFRSSAFGDPADHGQLTSSTYAGSTVDFVLIDRNHAPSGSYYPEVSQHLGSGDYAIEAASNSGDAEGTHGPYTMSNSQVIRVWDSYLTGGERKYFAVKVVSGDADLGIALYDSDPATASTWYRSRSNYVAYADSAGAGEDEYLDYETATADWMGLAVWNSGATGMSSFYLYADTTAPSGSASIDSGASFAASPLVDLLLPASDSETGVAEMRLTNAGSPWGAWEPYAASTDWTLTAGDGVKTVNVQYRNNAGMSSATYSDTITLDATDPSGSIVIDGGATYATSAAVTLTLPATDGSGSGVSQMRFSSDGSSWSAWEPYAAGKGWTLSLGDGSKTVFVQYQDAAGNASPPYDDAIILDTSSPSGSILIDGGATYATSTSVMLSLSASDGAGSGVSGMRFSSDGVSWSSWEPYLGNRGWTLSTGDGTKMVYVQYQDSVGHVSAFYNDAIVLDTTAPTGSIVVDGGAIYATSPSVVLTLSGSDGTGSGVSQMRFSSDGTGWSEWEPYATSKEWNLPAGDGIKTVYVQYRDAAGHPSTSYDDTIILDSAGPDGSIVIDDGATYATSTSVVLTLSSSDGAGSGVTQMRFSNSGVSWSIWEPYATSKDWTLATGDGTKTVTVQYRDAAGNVSAYDDTVILDTTGPSGSILIDGGATYAGSTSVILTLTANDGAGVTQMRFHNAGLAWSEWEPYVTSKNWTLAGPNGTKTVYVQYSDGLGNLSTSYNDTIILDTAGPTGSIVIEGDADYAVSNSVVLTLSASDETGSGVVQMRFSIDGVSWGSWEPYATTKGWALTTGDGTKAVYVQYRDAAGNASTVYEDTIFLDTADPTGSVLIDGDALYATSTSVALALSASDGVGSGVAQMRFSNDGSSWSSWETYAPSRGWTLAAGDGTKAAYVQYRDAAGNASPSYSDTIVLDTTGPTGSIAVDEDASFTRSTLVVLSLSAGDGSGSGVAEMHFSGDSSSWSSWEPFDSTRNWTLPVGDGTKTVYVQYRDALGNVSLPYDDTIVLDTAGPTGSIVVDGDAPYVNSTSVVLTLSAGDGSGSGVSGMRFSNDGASWSIWEPYAATKGWTLVTGDGTKTVYVQYRDAAGNESIVIEDTTILDTADPTGSILIDEDVPYANTTSVVLALSASDGAGSGVAQMRFADNGSPWSSWEPYVASKEWTLTTGDGTKTVYVQYRDAAGNDSSAFDDAIVLDTSPPTSSASSPAATSSFSFTVTWSGVDTSSGVASYDVQYRAGAGGSWVTWSAGTTTLSAIFGPDLPVMPQSGTIYYFRVRATDNAGNVEPYPEGDGDTSTAVGYFSVFLPETYGGD